MGALTETTAQAVTEFPGKVRVVTAIIDGATTGTITVSGISTILAVLTQLAEDSTANCCGYSVTVSGNVITADGIKGDGDTSTTGELDWHLIVLGY